MNGIFEPSKTRADNLTLTLGKTHKSIFFPEKRLLDVSLKHPPPPKKRQYLKISENRFFPNREQ